MANDQQKPSDEALDVTEEVQSAGEVAPDSASADVVEGVIDESGQTQQANDAQQSDLALARDEIERLKQDVQDTQLRAQAEIQNVRRRAEQDVEKAHKFALDKFAQELLPVIDSLERTVDACPVDDEATKALREGAQMTLDLFINSLAKFNLTSVDPTGQAFDPALHQAMSMVDAPDAEPNTVVGVMQKGYTLNGRLVRPAMVMVAKA
ncbi:nucleotide exchange factor GrpE [Nitrincola iocasae]|jgi:molecular chaperone GrpE|uniref:Protein GrpE n=1 Tax=Nitrincola iocasae TaxID=2614693 RepID=A0A5J6LIF1_9GAMM|nr:nucleotide exchange factor GrpE [Nitrincola iocasae]QEW07881.1 nucleotide exchange factor GrpE [Nitrincola iocasae]